MNKKLLKSFIEYCRKNKNERFWQALRNWSRATRIFYEYYDKQCDDNVCKDTFYFENRNN